MGKKKNLTNESCDNGPILTQTLTEPPLKVVNCNGKSDCKSSSSLTNGSLIHEPEESQCIRYANGVDGDQAPSDTTTPKNCHLNQLISSHDSVEAVANGTGDDESSSTNVSSEKVGSDSNQNSCSSSRNDIADEVSYIVYESELQMPDIMKLIQKDLSEPYSIYTYRYFIHNWPHLCFMVCFNYPFWVLMECALNFRAWLGPLKGWSFCFRIVWPGVVSIGFFLSHFVCFRTMESIQLIKTFCR